MQAAGAVEADVVLDVERVTLAGHQHVFDARQAHLRRLAGEVRNHRAQARRACGLSFLATETTAHAAHVDDDFVHRYVEHFGNQFLYFGRVLRRTVNDHAAVFGGHYRGDLRLQVEVFLTADVQRALDAVFSGRQRGNRIAALVGVTVEDEVAFAQGFDHVEHGFEIFVFDDRGHRGFARGFQILRGDGKHRLTDELHVIDGQQRVARHQRADVFQARHVFVGDGDAHAFEGVARLGVDADDFRVGAVRQPCVNVQLVRKLQAVVDVLRFTGHVLGGAVVLDAAADTGGQVLGEQFSQFGLGLLYGVMVRHKRSPESRCAVFAVR
ncbi:hypothetical protein D3C84_604870 [compost metagenome]